MSTHPLATIVIPCYNGAALVQDAIESALAQTYPHVEVVVVDDGSTDDSLSVIRSFGDRIRYETGPNRGGGAARNRGVKLACGELIQFLDSDDLLHPDKLERQVPVLLARAADVVCCDVRDVDLAAGELIRTCSPTTLDTFAKCCFDDVTTPGPLHWKANLDAVGGFDPERPCSQERDLHLRMAAAGMTFTHIPESLVTARRQPGSVSSNHERVLDVRAQIVETVVNQLLEKDELTDHRRRCLAGMLARDGRAYLRMNRPDKAARTFVAARQLHPDGGLDTAYTPPTRLLRSLIGAARTESLIQWKRSRSNMSRNRIRQVHPASETGS